MWCSSLRKRPEWVPAVRVLPDVVPRIKEGKLNSHDIALPTGQHNGQKPRILRLLLLSQNDLGTRMTEERLDHLYNLQGGQDVAAIVLLSPSGEGKDPMEAFMKLQMELLGKQMGINLVPLLTAAGLPDTLAALRPSLPAVQQPATPGSLLRHMVSGRPLSEDQASLLSELGRTPSEVAALAETEEGQRRMLGLLGEADGKRVLDFLTLDALVLLT
ncbi:hypothetical protein CPLU01_01358 [Colletotrichum plurivorum]|uniref:Uncharacterized protein n=1 Tax=Colletotrichum plurivorum TaxID=2175906 RepID=A0A8H6U1T0_9PEZI|nr:hypothetical protein CPLU01_01358 [Colletotrichum plurivorum]